MMSIAQVGITPSELDEMVEGEVWSRWCAAEPALAQVRSLTELDLLRGAATDGPLGALVRLAAKDGGDDELAGIAVVHQLSGGVRRLVRQFRNLTADVEAVVIGALWEQIRTFPWQRRTRSYAANLIYDTRAAVTNLLLPGRTRGGGQPMILIDPQSGVMDALAGADLPTESDTDCAEEDLADLLAWAIKHDVITPADARLLVELVAAGHDHNDPCTSGSRGPCSLKSAARVARRRGQCTKTVIRQRDQIVARLRATTRQYLAEAA